MHRNDETQQALDLAGKVAQKTGKTLVKKAGKIIFKIIAPYLPIIFFILLIIGLVYFIVGAVFSSTPKENYLPDPNILSKMKN